jgi:hypothetical protein
MKPMYGFRLKFQNKWTHRLLLAKVEAWWESIKVLTTSQVYDIYHFSSAAPALSHGARWQ